MLLSVSTKSLCRGDCESSATTSRGCPCWWNWKWQDHTGCLLVVKNAQTVLLVTSLIEGASLPLRSQSGKETRKHLSDSAPSHCSYQCWSPGWVEFAALCMFCITWYVVALIFVYTIISNENQRKPEKKSIAVGTRDSLPTSKNTRWSGNPPGGSSCGLGDGLWSRRPETSEGRLFCGSGSFTFEDEKDILRSTLKAKIRFDIHKGTGEVLICFDPYPCHGIGVSQYLQWNQSLALPCRHKFCISSGEEYVESVSGQLCWQNSPSQVQLSCDSTELFASFGSHCSRVTGLSNIKQQFFTLCLECFCRLCFVRQTWLWTGLVGYHVRFSNRTSSSTKLKCTRATYVCTRELQKLMGFTVSQLWNVQNRKVQTAFVN